MGHEGNKLGFFFFNKKNVIHCLKNVKNVTYLNSIFCKGRCAVSVLGYLNAISYINTQYKSHPMISVTYK